MTGKSMLYIMHHHSLHILQSMFTLIHKENSKLQDAALRVEKIKAMP